MDFEYVPERPGYRILPSQKSYNLLLLSVCFMDITLAELGSRKRKPKEILRSSPDSSKKTLSILTLLLRFTFYV